MNQTSKRTLGIIGAALVALTNAEADFARYSGTIDLEVESGPVFASHHHDWAKGVSHIQLGDAQTRTITLSSDSPPFTHIWLSPEQRYFVGLSSVRVDNKTQLFVLDLQEDAKYERGVSCDDKEFGDGRNCAASVTNFVYWFDETAPEIEVDEIDGRPISITVNSYISDLCEYEDYKKRPESMCSQERISFSFESAK